MLSYILRRLIYAIPILIGVNLLTFVLFFMVNTPDDMARLQLGKKYVSPLQIDLWKKQHGYDKPYFYNEHASFTQHVTDTLFFKKSIKLFLFDFGQSEEGRDIGYDIYQRLWPSLALAIPTLLFGLLVTISLALVIALFRGTVFDVLTQILCVILMSISGLFYIIIGQALFAKFLLWVPISGYQGGWAALKFLVLPTFIGILIDFGASTRWYRVIFLEEINKDYVRTARAKGLSELAVLFKHVLKNAMLPILTGLVVIIPSLFLGSLIMESFFGIPGLGSYTLYGIQHQDFEIVRCMVFLGTILYIIGILLTDISYVLVDPRVRLNK